MKYKININRNGQIPKQANPGDLCADIYAASDPKIVGTRVPKYSALDEEYWEEIDYIEYDTELVLAAQRDEDPNSGTVGAEFGTLIFPRSSISKYNLLLHNSLGVVDVEYRGTLKLRFSYQFQPFDLQLIPEFIADPETQVPVQKFRFAGRVNQEKIYQFGDRIGQILPIAQETMEFEVVDSFDAALQNTERGSGGFGSSGA